MTVPPGFRRNSEIPGILVLHYAELPETDIQAAHGFRLTRPLRTVLDLVEEGTVERGIILQALKQAVDRGLITRQQIRSTPMNGPVRGFFEHLRAA